MTQKNIILTHLLHNKSITSYESFDKYGILDLQSVIRLLRKDYIIADEWIHTTNRYGFKVKFKQYFLVGKKEN